MGEKIKTIRIKIGDHLVSSRGVYTHHGIYVGQNTVIHYSGLADGLQTGPIEKVSIEKFQGNGDLKIKPHPHAMHNGQKAKARALSRLGEDAYSLTGNNCEHFVNWCIDDEHKSNQVDTVVKTSSSIGASATGLAARSVIGSAGTVVGLSGSGVMSGLASVGGVVGGGAVAGAGILAGSGGLAAATLINNTILADDKSLDKKERKARNAGRKASYAGAAAGTAGGIAAVSAAGTAGLSSAGITSGLAAIGSTVGGGMAAGTAIVVAAPVAAAAAIGYGIYKFFQSNKQKSKKKKK
ncbi:hypothetical protein Sulku_2419 [Sulfuricurvum kujiense DSM 16994]|uniref:LRAT domain-containing protein n=1 Tax=Sulfuricurvum kujiense (strain ATCC BAA-921 / DSM 16994 / JCM 11577 / YK-1) TaxID=709032 RepID=E4TYD4_SULKY|nr:lecithin retinol acyltransferase family protein [Sulfuricurvum kujiense]ADR35079.1 hypothetical protein Sulku_2419 [Sulfuricurvum kujiense DSM 16994]